MLFQQGLFFPEQVWKKKNVGSCGSVCNNLASAAMYGWCQVEAGREFLVTTYPKMDVLI